MAELFKYNVEMHWLILCFNAIKSYTAANFSNLHCLMFNSFYSRNFVALNVIG